jgi:hypothetical protein
MSEASDRWTVNLDGALLQDRFQVERMIGGRGMANVHRDIKPDGTFVLTTPAADGRSTRPLAGRWEFEAGTLRLRPDPASVPKIRKRDPQPFTAVLQGGRLMLRRPGAGPGLPLTRMP